MMLPLDISHEAKQKIWTQLSQPECDFVIFLTVCHLHAVEACVAISKLETIDEFAYFLLKAIDALGTPDVEDINSLLHIGRQVIMQIAATMEKNDLLSINSNGVFIMTAPGKESLKSGLQVNHQSERRIFYFLDRSNEHVRINKHSRDFLGDLDPNDTSSGWSFDINTLQACIDHSDDWKSQHQFPLDVHTLITPSSIGGEHKNVEKKDTIVIDKAQYTNCAMFVKFKNDKPMELSAYPISYKGYLLDKNCLFSLKGEEPILDTFPHIAEMPSEEHIYKSFRMLGDEYSLDKTDEIEIKNCVSHTVVKIKNDAGINWAKFYWQHAHGNIFCDTLSATAARMNRLDIDSDNKQAIKLLYELSEAGFAGDHIKDMPAYKAWLLENGYSLTISIRMLASLAWDLCNYRLAYSLSELEDMADVNP